MTQLLNIQGAAGTGKTTSLLKCYVDACEVVGPERVLAVTFTRAAADELRERCAAVLGISDRGAALRRRLPWCGTIHSICLKLSPYSPSQLIDNKKLREFDRRLERAYVPDLEAMETWAQGDLPYRTNEAEAALWVRSAALHRMISIREAIDIVDAEILMRIDADEIPGIIEKYDDWKKARKYVDFEDLLLLGRDLRPPVRVVLADECQDNSPLLWSVVNAWGTAPETASYICAGDAYQALYAFAGGDPRLFSGRDGAWHVIRESHRFDRRASEYARAILNDVFADDQRFDLLSDFEGVGGTAPDDGTRFWLARTNALVDTKASELMNQGVPFRRMGKRGPLQSNAANGYRALLKQRQGEPVSREDLVSIAKALADPGAEQYLKALPAGYYGPGTVQAAFGRDSGRVMNELPYAGYLLRILNSYGPDALFITPKLALGTVHSAKGKEAHEVTLCTNWASKPYGNLITPQGARDECCVSYVGATRHKARLILEDLWTGGNSGTYPFPGGPSDY